MLSVSVQELQKKVGDVQAEALREPVMITSHGRPRCVLVSVEEFTRLKLAAGEPMPVEFRKRQAATFRSQPDPLGFELADIDAAMRAMTQDAASGRNKEAVNTELAAVRRRFGSPSDRQQ